MNSFLTPDYFNLPRFDRENTPLLALEFRIHSRKRVEEFSTKRANSKARYRVLRSGDPDNFRDAEEQVTSALPNEGTRGDHHVKGTRE
jgi:hypothetical protein